MVIRKSHSGLHDLEFLSVSPGQCSKRELAMAFQQLFGEQEALLGGVNCLHTDKPAAFRV